MGVMGRWMLSILDGHCRYAHVCALRGDGLATHIHGTKKVVNNYSLHRALGSCPRRATDCWRR